MASKILYYTLLVLSFLCWSQKAIAVKAVSSVKKEVKSISDLEPQDVLMLNKHELSAKLGRKLKLKERIVLRILKRKLRKEKQLNDGKDGDRPTKKWMAVLGISTLIIGFLLLSLPVILLGLLVAIFSNDKLREHPGKLITEGLVTIAIFVGVILLGIFLVTLFIRSLVSR